MLLIRRTSLLIGDILILYISLAITLVLRYGTLSVGESFRTHLFPFSLIFIVWILSLTLFDLYHPKTSANATFLLRELFVATISAAVISTILFYLFTTFFELTPKTNLFIFTAVFFVFSYGWRWGAKQLFTSGATPIIILGDSPLIKTTNEYIISHPHFGYRVEAWVRSPTTHDAEKLRSVIRSKRVALVITQPGLENDFSTLQTMLSLFPLGVAFMNFLDFYELIFEKVPIKDLNETWFIENISTRRRIYDYMKLIVDFMFSLLLSIALLPIGIFIALLIAITSSGNVLYKQKRVGKNGSSFVLYKFRTMRSNESGALWTEKNDSRITPIGKFLRATHLDELPQLWNILRGNISFTGPRPERTELAEHYGSLPYYDMRHVIKPGLSGWAQINYKPSASLDEAYEKLQYDLYYVKNRSLLLDFLIVLKTIRYLFTNHK